MVINVWNNLTAFLAMSLDNIKELNADHNHGDMEEDDTEIDDGMELQYYIWQKNYLCTKNDK